MKSLPRNIILLGFVSFFTDLSSQMVFPLIPLFLTHVLGSGGLIVGLVEGAAEATASLLKVAAGFYSDKIRKRKPFILFGYSLSSLLKPLFSLATVWPTVLLIRILERIGKGLRDAPRDALIADNCPPEIRGKAFGFHRMMDGAGSLAGALLAWVFLAITSYKNIFLLSIIPAVLSVFTILLVKDLSHETSGKGSHSYQLKNLKLPRELWLFLLATAVFAFGHFGYSFFLLRASGISDRTAILLYAIFYASYALTSYPAGLLADRFGKRRTVLSGYILFAVVCLFMTHAQGFIELLAGFIMYGIFFASIDGNQRAYIAEISPEHLRGTSLGLFHTLTGIAALPGGIVAGWLWDNRGYDATFLLGTEISLLSISLFLIASSRLPGKPKKQNIPET